MYAHQLNLNLDKTEPLFFGNCCPLPFCFHWGPSGNGVLNGALNCRKLECDTDDQLFFAANITATTCSCRLVLHDIKMICVLNAKKAVQVLRMQIAPGWPAYCMSSDMWSSFIWSSRTLHTVFLAHWRQVKSDSNTGSYLPCCTRAEIRSDRIDFYLVSKKCRGFNL